MSARGFGMRRTLHGLTPLVPSATQTTNQENAGNGLYLPPWIYPPINWENVDLLNYVLMPAVLNQSNIISFRVPPGRNGVIRKIACNFVGGGWVEGSGAVSWQILVDGTVPAGASSYDNILASLGSPANPVEIPGFRIFDGQTITVVARNTTIQVAGQLMGARLVGYMYPREAETEGGWV